MWTRLLALCAATRRPLVFKDYETAGLGGAPPVEYAIAYWAPWQPPEMDAVSVRARRSCPPGLTYAATGRLNPGVPIHPDAQAVHGIMPSDVAKCLPYNDLGLVSVFRALAAGDPAEDEGPAVWCGHNAAESDIPWSQAWGYLPRDPPVDVIDTCRLSKMLTASHPMPLAPDAVDWLKAPVVGHGLTPYNDKLIGLHTALFGDPPRESHAALADVCATARCLHAVLSLWSPLWPGPVQGEDPHAALTTLLAALNTPLPGVLSWDGWLRRDLAGGITWSGKAKKVGGAGRPLNCDPDYARWVAALPRLPTGVDGQAWCSAVTVAALQQAV